MKERKLKHNPSNGGYSLIELIVTILISAIIVVAVVGFLTTGLKHYRNVSAETALQTESQVVELFVTELFQEAESFKTITTFPSITDDMWTAGEHPAGSTFSSVVQIKRGTETFILAKIGNELHYKQVTASSESEQLIQLVNAKKSTTFLGRYVEIFQLADSTNTAEKARASNGLIYLSLKFKVDQKEYDSTSVITLRNTKKN